MSSTRTGHRARSIRLGWAAALAVGCSLALAPAAFAWHGTLTVKSVNSGGDPTDTFAYTAKVSGTQLTGGAFTLTGGQEKSFTNQATGGEGGAGSWKPFVVAQTDDTRYTTAVACSIDPVWDGTGKDGSIWAPVYSADAGEHRAGVELRWWSNVAYTTTCVFTNTARPTTSLKVIKHVVGGPPGARFDLTADGVVKRADAADGEGTEVLPLDAGAHTIGERGATLSDYVAGAACQDATGAPVDATGPADGHEWNVVLRAGAAVTCTITNTRKAQVTIAKITDPPSSALDRPTFSFLGGLGTFAIAHGGSQTVDVAPGRYDVTEAQRDGFELTAIACSDAADAAGASTVNVPQRIAMISAEPGEQLTCTFTNTETDPGGIIATRRPTATTAAIKPMVSVRGAVLSGSTGCVVTAAVAEVKGRQVKRVMFYVDGKAVRYLHRRADGRYALRHPAARLAPGTHKLRARVRFTRASGLAPVSLQMKFTRCG